MYSRLGRPATRRTAVESLVRAGRCLACRIVLLRHRGSRVVMMLDESLVLLLLLLLKAGIEQLVVDVLAVVVLLQCVAAGLLLLLWATVFLHVAVSSSEL